MIEPEQPDYPNSEPTALPSSGTQGAIQPKNASPLTDYVKNLFIASLFLISGLLIAGVAYYPLRAACTFAWKTADNAGYISHTQVSQVAMPDDWQVGEYRLCTADARPLGGEIGTLVCPALQQPEWQTGAVRQFPVRYWGRVARRELEYPFPMDEQGAVPEWEWRCQRESASLKCWAIN